MRLLFIVAVIASGLLYGWHLEQDGLTPSHPRTFVSFEPMNTVVVKGKQSTPVEFTFHVQQGYHINSNQPSDPELIPTQLRFSLPGDLVIAKVQYPAGQLTSFPFNPNEKLSVYSGDVAIKAVVMAQAGSTPGVHTVHGELRYQACDNNSCYPPKKLPIDFEVKVASASSSHPRSNPQSPHIH
jgi:DsbC/DsbD-like thiol-disulfide interchange protein